MTGRVEVYVHSDKITNNKGMAAVKVSCDTDFCAKTEEFKAFTSELAKLAYGAEKDTFEDVCSVFPNIKEKLDILRDSLKENIVVEEISIMKI